MGNKFLFAVITALFNHWGLPSFLQGRKKTGIVRLLVGLFTFGIGAFINFILGVLLAVQIMGMDEDEFQAQKYVLDKGIPSARMLGEGDAQKGEVSSAPAYDVQPTQSKTIDGYNVCLNSCGENRFEVLQVIMEIAHCEIEEADDKIENKCVLIGVSEEEADRAIMQLEQAGAEAYKQENYVEEEEEFEDYDFEDDYEE